MLGQREVVSHVFRAPGTGRLSPASDSAGSSRTDAVSAEHSGTTDVMVKRWSSSRPVLQTWVSQ